MQSEISLIEEQDYSSIDFDKPYKEKDKKKFNEFQWYIYESILMWRNEKAALKNIPSFKILDKRGGSLLSKFTGNGNDSLPYFKTVNYSYRQELTDNLDQWKQYADMKLINQWFSF